MRILHTWTITMFILLGLPFCRPNCAIVGSPTGIPPKKLAKPAPPFLIKDNPACPYYINGSGCCNDIQIHQLEENFKNIDMIFAEDCPICAVILKIFWCEFACNPNQSDFSNFAILRI